VNKTTIVKNALLKSITMVVGEKSLHTTLYFQYADGDTQSSGAQPTTFEFLKALASITGEREIFKISDKPCRVRCRMIEEGRFNAGSYEIVAIGHYLNEEWFSL
jgi:hypothetical protein